MLSASLRLRSLVNDPSVLDPSAEFVALDNQQPATLFVYGEKLAGAILKSDTIRTYDLIGHWKMVVRGREVQNPKLSELPTLEKLFAETPFFLHGGEHRPVRKSLLAPYRRIEQQMDQWLPKFAREFFSGLDSKALYHPMETVASFIPSVFRQILVEELGGKPSDYPTFSVPSQSLFLFFPRSDGIKTYEANLTRLAEVVAGRLKTVQEDRSEDLWAILSVMVMGQEPLFGGLTYALVKQPQHGGDWDAVTLMRESAPVSLLGRKVLVDQELCGVQLYKDQPIHIAPFLVNERIDRAKQSKASEASPSACPVDHADSVRVPNSIEFGLGVHLCSGRNIALAITQAFLDGLRSVEGLRFDTKGIKLYRDFNLVPQKDPSLRQLSATA
jgi:hypothetical protein